MQNHAWEVICLFFFVCVLIDSNSFKLSESYTIWYWRVQKEKYLYKEKLMLMHDVNVVEHIVIDLSQV